MKNKIFFSIGILAIFGLMTVPLAQNAEAATFFCDGVISGTFDDDVEVNEGDTCIILSETTIKGNLKAMGNIVILSFGAPITIEKNLDAEKGGFVEIYAIEDGLITIGENLKVVEKDTVHIERVTVVQNVDIIKTISENGFAGIYKSIIGQNLKVEENTQAFVMDNEIGQNLEVVKNDDAVVDGNNIDEDADCKDGLVFAINNVAGKENNGC